MCPCLVSGFLCRENRRLTNRKASSLREQSWVPSQGRPALSFRSLSPPHSLPLLRPPVAPRACCILSFGPQAWSANYRCACTFSSIPHKLVVSLKVAHIEPLRSYRVTMEIRDEEMNGGITILTGTPPPVLLGGGRTLFSFSSYHESDHQGCQEYLGHQDHLQSKPRSPVCTTSSRQLPS